jgi:hypothetical protein
MTVFFRTLPVSFLYRTTLGGYLSKENTVFDFDWQGCRTHTRSNDLYGLSAEEIKIVESA